MKKIFTLLTALVVTAGATNAQILTFDFVGALGNEATLSSNTNDANITSSTISRGSGLTTSTNGDRFNCTSITTAASLDVNDYVEFTVTAQATKKFSISSIVVLHQRSGTGPLSFALRSNADAFASDLGSVFAGADVTTTQTATFTFTMTDVSTSVTFRLYPYASEAGTGTWGPGDGPSANDIVVNGTTGTLPISLVKFTADKISEKVKLNWVTATEINNDKFIIERSADGENFELVAEVKGAGNSREINSYNVVDATPLKGTSYYRLRQVDFNGASETFTPVAVNMTGKLHLATVQSNTEAGNIDLNIYSPSVTSTAIRITDLSGRTIASQQVNLVEGYQSVNINTNNLSSGIHIIQIMNGEEVVMKKLVL